MTVQRVAGVILLLAASAAPASAQRASRLVADSAGKLAIAFCNLRMAGKVGDGQKALRAGIEDKDAAKRAASLDQAVRILTEQITSGGQGESAAAWYYLARAYLAQGDVTGADSAFTRAQRLAPDCEIDIGSHRQNAWALLANAGIEKLRANEADSALVLFRQASTLFADLPHVFENMGVVYANQGQVDSAAHYFGRAAAAAEADTAYIENRNSATLNQAMMLQRLERHPEAIASLEKYLGWNPKDTDARKSLAFSLRAAGQTARADSLEQAMVSEFATMNFDSLSAGDLMAVGVSMFNAQKFTEAAQVFERLARQNPWSRDAVYNLANSYLALKAWDKLAETGRQLRQIEPMNEDAYRLSGQAYRELKQQDSLIRAAETMVALPVAIEVSSFNMGTSVTRLEANVTGRKATDAAGKDLAPTPVTITVEFLNPAGEVLGAQDVNIPALEPGATHQIRAEARVGGVTGWRYRRK